MNASELASSGSLTISGTRRFYTNSGEIDLSVQFAGSNLAVYGATKDGGFATYPCSGAPGFPWTCPSVPAGNVLVRFGSNFVETAGPLLDLSSATLGRMDQVRTPIVTQPSIDLTLSGTSGDVYSLDLYSPNANAAFPGVGILSNMWGSPTTGVIQGHMLWGRAEVPNTVDASRGDTTYITQMSVVPYTVGSKGYQVSAVNAGFTSNTFTTTNHGL